MATQIFDHADDQNARRAHTAWMTDPTQTILYDGAGRYAVGHLGEMEEKIDAAVAPENWEWLEVEQAFYDPA